MAELDFQPRPETVPRETVFGPIVQLAYHVPDIEAAAAWWAAEMGAGPFFLLEHVPLKSARYRGAEASFDHSSGYGQLGDIMIELIHQHDDAPSAVRDMFDAQTPGLHHAAVFADDVGQSVQAAALKGYECALDAYMEDGFRFSMVDARQDHGHMIEFYKPIAALQGFYQFVAFASQGWDGKDVLRRLE